MHQPPQTSLAAVAPDSHGARGVILVVDDDEGNRDALSRRLQRRGYTIELAVDGESALKVLDEMPIDLVLLDVMMPGINGLEVLSRIRLTRPPTDLPVIMVTARDTSDDVVTALSMGASDYLSKPLDFAVVLARVQTQLALRAAVQQVFALERHLVRRNAELEKANHDLERSAQRTRNELKLATKVQASYLPRDLPVFDGLSFAWRYEPSLELAGDALNICPLGKGALGLYVLDVSGHGVAASLTAVSAARLLAAGHDPDTILVRDSMPMPPAEVALRLGQSFAWNSETEQFMTLCYALYDHSSRIFRYVSAGHPPVIRVSRDGVTSRLEGTGLPIGVGLKFEDQQVQLDPGDRVYFYSDGVIESSDSASEHFGVSRLAEATCRLRSESLDASLGAIMEQLDQWRGGAAADR